MVKKFSQPISSCSNWSFPSRQYPSFRRLTAEFLESLKTHPPDCTILDIHMPLTNGFFVQARLAEAGIQLPVVIISGHDAAETRKRTGRRCLSLPS